MYISYFYINLVINWRFVLCKLDFCELDESLLMLQVNFFKYYNERTKAF